MELLKNRILNDGQVIDNSILKVDNFLNHQIDVNLFNEMGKEFKRRFKDKKINKILTVEVSGIAVACIAAQYFNVPVVFAKKHKGINMDSNNYEASIFSFTKKTDYKIRVSKKYLEPEDHILLIDDFLASGNAVIGLMDIINQSGATLEGVGIVIEKSFQGGRELLEEKGIQIESLARIKAFENGKVIFQD